MYQSSYNYGVTCMLKKTTRVSLVEQVVHQIEQLIESGKWSVGDRIPPEMELMKKFDVSRNTLREAIRALVHAGLLETKQGSGTIIRSSSALGVAINRHAEKSSMIEILEVRLALEREAAILAAKRRSETDVKKLTEYIRLCQDAIQDNDVEKFIEKDILFHKTIVKAANNQMLYELYEHISESIYESVHEMITMDPDFQFEKEIHSELLQAIIRKDVKAATDYVNQYIHTFKEKIKSSYGGLDD